MPYVVYLIEGQAGICKIGLTRDVEQRFVSIQSQSAMQLRLLAIAEPVDACSAEREMHVAWHHRRVFGEWFRLSPSEIEEAVAQMKALDRPRPPARPVLPPFEPLLIAADVCSRYGLELKEVYRRAKAREIPAYQLRGIHGWRFRASELDQVLTPVESNL